ncbi:MAG: hypothetical protein KGM60_10850 [Comamonadaceae bacterium]|nr:hypothetical protein [Comamonadaceae bacterium]
MSFDSYAALQAALAARVKRSDLASRMPDYIRLTEARIMTLIDPRLFDSTADLVTAPGADSVALPDDYKNPVALWIADINPQERLMQVLAQEMPYNATPNRPRYWCIDGGALRLQCPANGVYPLKFRYQRNFALSDANPTNEVLREYPDIYFYGALAELADDIFDDNNAVKWDAKFRDAIQRANDQEASNNKFVPLATEIGRLTPQRFNIFRGY